MCSSSSSSSSSSTCDSGFGSGLVSTVLTSCRGASVLSFSLSPKCMFSTVLIERLFRPSSSDLSAQGRMAISEPACPDIVDMRLACSIDGLVPIGEGGEFSLVSLILPALLGGAVTPPFVGRPSRALAATQFLYFVMGKRSLTSSILISFFSRLRRCGRGMFSRTIGSGPSPAACRARLRALYLKQYLTPTIILCMMSVCGTMWAVDPWFATYHKLVKTTPKPRATKKSSGELVVELPPPPPDEVVVALGVVEVAVAPGEVVEDGDACRTASSTDLPARASTSSMAVMVAMLSGGRNGCLLQSKKRRPRRRRFG